MKRDERLLNFSLKFCKIFFGMIVLPITLLSLLWTALFPIFREKIIQMALPKLTQGVISGARYSADYALERVQALLDETHHLIHIGSPFIWIPLWAVLGGIVILKVLSKLHHKYVKMILCGVLFFLMGLDLFYYGYRLRPSIVDAHAVFKKNESLSFLTADKTLFRIASLQPAPKQNRAEPGHKVFKPNLGMMYGLYDIGGHESLIDRTYAIFSRTILQNRPDARVDAGVVLDFENLNLKLAGMMNVKYLISKSIVEGLAVLQKSDGIVISKNPYFLPRAYFVPKYQVDLDIKRVFQKLGAPSFDPKKVVYLDRSPGLLTAKTQQNHQAEVKITSYKPNRVEMDVFSNASGILVLADAFAAGWYASLDGESIPIYRANAILRGVSVPEGRHRIVFKYRPRLFVIGCYLALVTLCLGACFIIGSSSKGTMLLQKAFRACHPKMPFC